MGTAFGISLEDVQTVLSSRFGIEASDDEAQAFYDDLCHDLIEDVALNGDDMAAGSVVRRCQRSGF